MWAPYGTVLAAYGPFYYRRDRRASFAAVGTLALLVAAVWESSAAVIATGVLRTATGPLVALYFTARHEVMQALRDRAERAEQERYLLAEQARAEERARLAGEMHDVVTHRVSLMVLQAGALGITARDDETRQAAEELRAAGCQALDELRDLVGILRTEPGSDQTPSVSGLPALIAESAAAGTRPSSPRTAIPRSPRRSWAARSTGSCARRSPTPASTRRARTSSSSSATASRRSGWSSATGRPPGARTAS